MVKYSGSWPRLRFVGGGGVWLFMRGRGSWLNWLKWVASDFARQILSFSTLHRAGLVACPG